MSIRTIGRGMGACVLGAGAALVVCALSLLALLITVVCAPPLNRMRDPEDQAP